MLDEDVTQTQIKLHRSSGEEQLLEPSLNGEMGKEWRKICWFLVLYRYGSPKRDVWGRGWGTHFIDLYFRVSLTCKDIKSVLLLQSSTNQDNNASKMEFATLATFAKTKQNKKTNHVDYFMLLFLEHVVKYFESVSWIENTQAETKKQALFLF